MRCSIRTLPCLITFTLLVSLLGGCQPAPAHSPELEQATAALQSYFQSLSEGRYADAVDLYGGTYEPLTGYNPDINPQAYARLFELGCAANGLQCLQVNEILQSERLDDDTYQFLVTFTGRDGQVFVLGPCCGADETQMPPVSQFTFTVKRVDGRFKVMDLSVYVP